MKLSFVFLLSIYALFSLSGCSMLDSLRNESAAIDREEDSDREEPREYAVKKPKGMRGLSANNNPYVKPPFERGYGRRLASLEHEGEAASSSPPPEFRRVTRADFVDNKVGENSLWDDQGQGNYLFSHNRERQMGDLVTVDVEKELKREIQYQLWMTLPPEQRKVKKKPLAADGKPPAEGETAAAAPPKPADNKSADEKNRDAAEEAAKTNLASGGKDDDIVRMEVAESLGNGIVRVIGQKRVIYRGLSRTVEVMALVNNKDVDDNSRVKSSAFLDMKTQVIQ